MKWFKEVKERWESKSPIFWKKILKTAITIGTSATAVITSDKFFDLRGYGVPDIIFQIAGYVIVACAAVGLSAKITRDDNAHYQDHGRRRRNYNGELDA